MCVVTSWGHFRYGIPSLEGKGWVKSQEIREAFRDLLALPLLGHAGPCLTYLFLQSPDAAASYKEGYDTTPNDRYHQFQHCDFTGQSAYLSYLVSLIPPRCAR